MTASAHWLSPAKSRFNPNLRRIESQPKWQSQLNATGKSKPYAIACQRLPIRFRGIRMNQWGNSPVTG
ncbi:MAG: hypothetical protein JNM43_17940 [Planctomycetaceae bacterium]|nr:hypothetical protein [Planctomycetaceae bacterium]